LSLKLSHLLDLVQVYHEALLVCVLLLDALSAEDGEMVGAVEVLHSLLVVVANFGLQILFILFIELN
jgi:hypothetical protein